jgi:hypothetical protein
VVTILLMATAKKRDEPPRPTLEALGRVMLRLNELEFVIATQLEIFVGCESEELVTVLIRDLRFVDKTDKLRALIRVHACETSLDKSPLVAALNSTLDDAKKCATQRNQLAHGIVRFDERKKCFVSTLKGKEYVLRTRALNELAETMFRVSARLFLLCIRFTEALGSAYKERGTRRYFTHP